MNKETALDLSIIVVSWNTRNLLAQCLHSILATITLPQFQIIVVDNNSTDGSAELVANDFPLVQLITNSKNLGFARATNQGIQASCGKHILLLNSDTILQPGSIHQMLEFMNANPQAGIVGGTLLNPDLSPQRCFGAFPNFFSESLFAWGLDSRLPFSLFTKQIQQPIDAPHETDWVLGAALLIRRAVFQQIGMLDEDYFMYSEEIDMCYRAKKIGWRIYVIPNTPIIHLGGQSTRQTPGKMKAELFRSKVRYFGKHFGSMPAMCLRCMFGLSILVKQWVYHFRGNSELSDIWANAWVCFRNAQR
jgi:GT2 family glycosyltransferase